MFDLFFLVAAGPKRALPKTSLSTIVGCSE